MVLLIPSMVWANTISIFDVETPQAQTPSQAAELSVYFGYESSAKMPIKGLTADNCSILIDGKMPEVVQSKMVPFVEGDKGVGVLFVFPISKNYSEDSFGIRSHLKGLLQKMDRRIDQVNAVTYDRFSQPQGWTTAGSQELFNHLSSMSNTDDIEPNLFSSFVTSISAFDTVKGVSQKYLVLISDAEGAHFSDVERANTLISAYIDQLKKSQVIPIIIAYSPDGLPAMTNIFHLKRIASELNGYYFIAESESTLQRILQMDVYNVIYSKYLLKTTLDMSGDNYLPTGRNYPLELVVKTNPNDENGDHASVKIDWPDLTNSPFDQSLPSLNITDESISTWGIIKYFIVFLLGLFAGMGIMLAKKS